MTIDEIKILRSCTQSSQPPRARLWGWYSMMSDGWYRNGREGTRGYFNHVDVTNYLEANWSRYEEFLIEYNLKKFPYDLYFSIPEDDGLDKRTNW